MSSDSINTNLVLRKCVGLSRREYPRLAATFFKVIAMVIFNVSIIISRQFSWSVHSVTSLLRLNNKNYGKISTILFAVVHKEVHLVNVCVSPRHFIGFTDDLFISLCLAIVGIRHTGVNHIYFQLCLSSSSVALCGKMRPQLIIIENYTIQSGTHDFLLTFHIVCIGLSRTVSEINGDIRRKSLIFTPPVYLTPPQKGFPFPLRIVYRRRSVKETIKWWGFQMVEKVLDRFSRFEAIRFVWRTSWDNQPTTLP